METPVGGTARKGNTGAYKCLPAQVLNPLDFTEGSSSLVLLFLRRHAPTALFQEPC